MTTEPTRIDHPTDRWRSGLAVRRSPIVAGLVTAVVASLVGCKSTLDMSAFRNDDDEIERLASADGVKGPLERRLMGQRQRDAMHRLGPMEGQGEFEAARKLYDAGEYAEAEGRFKKLAKKYNDTPVEEDALFYLAESKFQRGHYPGAQDQYNMLLKEYPSTRHLEASTKRLFDIGREWLDFPKAVEASEVTQVNFDKPSLTAPPKDDRKGSWNLLPNFVNRKRPVFDAEGRGLEALRAIWLNDPTGPLADDALMVTASHHLRKGNYQQADYLFTILREEYPNSPHLEKSFVLGSHVKLMSYNGSQYDGQSLDAARQLKESTLRLFPDTETRERIEGELAQIERARQDREWEMVRFYQRKGKDRAVAMQCREVIRLFPNSEYAAKAKAILAGLPTDVVRLETPVRPPEPPGLLERLPRVPRLLPVPDETDEFDEFDEAFGDDEGVRDALPGGTSSGVIGPQNDRPVNAIDGVGRARF